MLKKFIKEYSICILGGIAVSAIWTIIADKGVVSGLILAIIIGTICWFILWIFEKVIKIVIRKKYYIEIHSMYQSQHESNKDIVDLVKQANEIDILTIRGLGIIGLNDAMLRKPIRSIGEKAIKIRVIMLSPSSNFVHERANEIGESYEVYKKALDLGINLVKTFKNETHHDVKIFLYDKRPCWRIIRIDNWYFVSVFDEHTEGHQANVYRIDGTKNGTLGKALKRHLEIMFTESKQDTSIGGS